MEWSSKPTDMELVRQSFDIESTSLPDEEALINALAVRVAEMLDTETDLLFSTLYRLDVAESKIQQVLASPAGNTARGLAILIIERQKEKIITRQKYRDARK